MNPEHAFRQIPESVLFRITGVTGIMEPDSADEGMTERDWSIVLECLNAAQSKPGRAWASTTVTSWKPSTTHGTQQ